MNSLSDLIDRLEAEPYYFIGSYWAADVSQPNPRPFEFDCEFTHDHKSVNVEGTYRAHSGAPQHPFRLSLPFKAVTQHAAFAELTAPSVETLTGTLLFVGGVGTFLARSKQATLSAHVSLGERDVIGLVGTFELHGKFFGYSLKGAIASYRASLSNVVGIRAPKRS